MDSSLHTGHESHSPRNRTPSRRIDDLPVEIFNRVMEVLRDVDPAGIRRGHKLGWLNVTFVSHGWRVSTLSNPSLWTRIPMNIGGTWTRIFLERSHPLLIDIYIENLEKMHMVDLLSRNFYRLNSLEATFDPTNHGRDHSLDPLYALIAQPSATVQTLKLRRDWRSIEYPRLRAHQYPHLRSLDIIFHQMRADEFPWQDIGNTGLIELKVYLKPPQNNQHCLAGILDTLSRLPSLVVFELGLRSLERNTEVQVMPQAHPGSLRHPHLSRLQRLFLGAEGELVFGILACVSFATSVETTLVPVPTRALDRVFLHSNLLPWISERSRMGSPKKLALTGGRYSKVQMSAVRSLDTDDRAFLHLTITSAIQDAFSDILHSLEPSTIRAIDIVALLELSLYSNRLLSQLSSVCHDCTFLRITSVDHVDRDSPGVAIAILRRLLLSSAGTSKTPSFPTLAHLDLTAFTRELISSRCTHPERLKPYNIMPPTFASSLASVVKARQNAGGNIPRVYLREWTGPMSRFEEGLLDGLRAIPGVVFLSEGSEVSLDET